MAELPIYREYADGPSVFRAITHPKAGGTKIAKWSEGHRQYGHITGQIDKIGIVSIILVGQENPVIFADLIITLILETLYFCFYWQSKQVLKQLYPLLTQLP